MRACVVLVAACSFTPGVPANTTPSDGRALDTLQGDATRAIDAAVDASTMCAMHATDMFGGHHYFRSVAGSWQASQADCAKFGGHLVKIETTGENMFVATTYAAGEPTG